MNIKSVKDLPKWFDLKKYEGLKTLDLAGWDDQIATRSLAYWHLTHSERSLSESMHDHCIKEASEHVRQVADNPIIARHRGEKGDISPFWSDALKDRPYNSYSVCSMSAFDAIDLSRSVNSESEVWGMVRAVGNAMDTSPDLSTEQRRLGNTPVDLIYRQNGEDPDTLEISCVSVNLSATDEQIMGDFRHWLTHYRNIVGLASRAQGFTEKDFSDWIDSGVIPYIDLKLWAISENCTITQNTYGNALFPDDIDVDTTDRIRRTTTPKANLLLQESTARALSFQVTGMLISQQRPALK